MQIMLKPYHLFYREGQAYLINIEDMVAITPPGTVVRALQGNLQFERDNTAETELKKIGLLDERKRSTSKSISKPYPITSMYLFLTQSCNLRCIYCYGDGGVYGTRDDMGEETAFLAVDWLIENSGRMKKINIDFFGGEPFLKFTLMQSVVQYAKKSAKKVGKKVTFSVTTNATLINDEILSFVNEEEILIEISIDGPKEIHDAQRPYPNGKGSYDSVIPKIKKVLASAPHTRGHAVLVGDTDPNLVKDALGEIGFREISILPVSQSMFDDNMIKAKEERRDTQKLVQRLEEQVDLWMNSIQRRDVLTLNLLKGNSDLYYAILSFLHHKKKRYACDAGLGMVAVSSTGDIYLCHRFVGQEDYRLGSIFQESLNWRRNQESPTTNNAICSTCFARYYCAGGCMFDNAVSCGSTEVPAEDMCRLRCLVLELGAMIVANLSKVDVDFLVNMEIFPSKKYLFDF